VEFFYSLEDGSIKMTGNFVIFISPSRGADNQSRVQEILRLLCKPEVHYCVHKSREWPVS